MQEVSIVVTPEVTNAVTIGMQGPAGRDGVTEMTFVAGEALGGHRIVTTNADGDAIYADSGDAIHAVKIAGMTTGAAVLGDSVQVQSSGELVEPTWAWTPGQALYVGSGGLIASAPPVTGFSLCVGFAVTATKIVINIGQPIIIS